MPQVNELSWMNLFLIFLVFFTSSLMIFWSSMKFSYISISVYLNKFSFSYF